jgi:hypothetical protein
MYLKAAILLFWHNRSLTCVVGNRQRKLPPLVLVRSGLTLCVPVGGPVVLGLRYAIYW